MFRVIKRSRFGFCEKIGEGALGLDRIVLQSVIAKLDLVPIQKFTNFQNDKNNYYSTS